MKKLLILIMAIVLVLAGCQNDVVESASSTENARALYFLNSFTEATVLSIEAEDISAAGAAEMAVIESSWPNEVVVVQDLESTDGDFSIELSGTPPVLVRTLLGVDGENVDMSIDGKVDVEGVPFSSFAYAGHRGPEEQGVMNGTIWVTIDGKPSQIDINNLQFTYDDRGEIEYKKGTIYYTLESGKRVAVDPRQN